MTQADTKLRTRVPANVTHGSPMFTKMFKASPPFLEVNSIRVCNALLWDPF